jgi:hypothetical protein
VIFTGLTRIAERPTGAGLPLRMGLRDINGKAGRLGQRRRSPAKPDGLGGVMSNLNSPEGIFAKGGNFLVRRRGRAFFSKRSLRKQ